MSITRQSSVGEDVLSVTQLARRVGSALRELGDGWIEGEIRSINQHRSGHVYLTLADEDSNLDACIWKGRVQRCLPLPKQGDLVQAHYERIDFYAPRGATKLIIDQIKPTGEGELLRRRALALERLRAEGLCDQDRRKPLPAFPRRVGVIAAQGSDAKEDVIRHLRQRLPSQDIVFAAASVQGVEAVGSVIDALGALQSSENVDVIILARGGGSVADLVAFDDERLCRAIFACSVPVITSIGHTKDRPNCDYVAAAFAPVPARAAEYAIAHSAAELIEELARHNAQLRGIYQILDRQQERLGDCWAQLRSRERIANLVRELRDAGELLGSRSQAGYRMREATLAAAQRRMEQLASGLPRANAINELRDQLTGVTGRLIAAHLRALEERSHALSRRTRQLPAATILDACAARLHGTAARMHERERDYRRAFDRLSADASRDLSRRRQNTERDLGAQTEDLHSTAQRSLDAMREHVAHLGALIDAKDFRRRGWVLAADSEGRGIRGVEHLRVGSSLGLWFADGEATATIDQLKPALEGER